MKTICQLLKRAKEYNEAIDKVLKKHEDSTIYWSYIPKLYGDFFTVEHAKNFLTDRRAEGESYDDAVSNYYYFVSEEVNEIIDNLKEAHAPEDLAHMEENIEGAQALLEYLRIINDFWFILV